MLALFTVTVALAGALVSPQSGGETVVPARKQATCTGAIAFRDLVPRDQQLGTAAFTRPYLNGAYDAVRYITEVPVESDDAHGEGADDARDEGSGHARDTRDDTRALSSRDVSRAAFVQAMKELRGCVVDVYFLVLGNDYASWVEAIAPRDRPRLRLVYDTGGGDADQGARWMAIGARAFVAHPGGNVAPVFYAWFLPCWLESAPDGSPAGATPNVEECVARANDKTHTVLHMGAVRAWLGDDEVAALWAGTEAVIFGDPHVHRVPVPARR